MAKEPKIKTTQEVQAQLAKDIKRLISTLSPVHQKAIHKTIAELEQISYDEGYEAACRLQ